MKKIKALLYCCKAKPYIMKYKDSKYKEIASFYNKQDLIDCELLNGTIPCECDFDVEEITPSTWNAETERRILKGSCLKEHQLFDYIIKGDENESQNPFYALHINNLHIFDEPRDIRNYYNIAPRTMADCMNQKALLKAPQNMCNAYDVYKNHYILISIQPKELCRILNGEQTILIKKQVLNCMKGNK